MVCGWSEGGGRRICVHEGLLRQSAATIISCGRGVFSGESEYILDTDNDAHRKKELNPRVQERDQSRTHRAGTFGLSTAGLFPKRRCRTRSGRALKKCQRLPLPGCGLCAPRKENNFEPTSPNNTTSTTTPSRPCLFVPGVRNSILAQKYVQDMLQLECITRCQPLCGTTTVLSLQQ